MPIYPGKTKGTLRVVLWAPREPHGPSMQHEKTFTGSARDAKLFEAQWRVQLRAGSRRELRGVPRFTRFCAEVYSPYSQKRVAKSTWDRHYAWAIAALCEHFGEVRMSDISTLSIQEYQTERDAAPSTVNGEVFILLSILNYAKRSHGVPIQEFDHKPLTTMKGRPKAWTEEQCKRLIGIAQRISPWQVPMLIFGLNTGCRKGEIVACEWSWIDIDMRMIRIPVNEYWHPKDGEPREVPMADAIYASLTAQPAPSKPTRGLWPVRPRHERWVFPTRDGGRHGEFPKEAFARLLTEAKLDGSPHWIRHTYASSFLRKKPDLPLLAKIMGHSTTYITELYAHMTQDHLAEGRNVVNIGAGPVAVTKKKRA